MLEMLKGNNKFFNNEVDATLTNPHFKSRVLGLLARRVTVTMYTDGANSLLFIGEGVNVKLFQGVSVLPR